jgi:hypothetical protein
MSTRRSSRMHDSHSRSLVLGAKRRRVEFDPDENCTHLSLTPGLVDNQVSSENGCSSAIGSEDVVASIMDELFDLEQDGEALTLRDGTISGHFWR